MQLNKKINSEGRQKILISFSGGKTSAYMTWFLLNEFATDNKYEFVVVFANTGKERKETLDFVHNCDLIFGFNTVWIESETHLEKGKGVSAKIVTYETASRNGEPFEKMIQKHGLPCTKSPHCSRELKKYAIRAYARSIGWKDYYTAIGIRSDEIDRMSPNRKKEKIIYPLCSFKQTTRQDINAFWQQQPFNLELKSYQGNCDLCWKKSFLKLHTILKEDESIADWWQNMEEKYKNFIPKGKQHNEKLKPPFYMYRGSTSVSELLQESKTDFIPAKDESNEVYVFKQNTLFDLEEYGCAESCEVF
ncbi:adenine nucleotide alpha hydrolase family protein [Parafilimonas terrae]|uniref:3'-phosphoadenosine 5'-phosphosulfate sulfotransferase (PAPS reductase)/FAD synthetase n=1 Tax=Parafilimonas terrae TaxID=1465490 RepID=A0A1I5ZGF5_9BACT|nr:phosphoadenosine phosphosulfate reductase family protein [Parafilimonas terrae]SFQ55531.1 3'-phosphoadenosine 5'-phosphosulfate sulfotransferase (PAPS reductase)/FAD synthetase [Parafilimonas terrae]